MYNCKYICICSQGTAPRRHVYRHIPISRTAKEEEHASDNDK